ISFLCFHLFFLCPSRLVCHLDPQRLQTSRTPRHGHSWFRIQIIGGVAGREKAVDVDVEGQNCYVLFTFVHVSAIGSFSHWVFNAPNEQLFYSVD
ncbi:hypothetical protein BDZ97DRAFT_1847517, partial [Flammula alnicola]